MKFRWFLLFFIVLIASSLTFAQNGEAISLVERTLLEREQMSWRYLAEKKFEEFARLLGKDFQGVYQSRLTNRGQELIRLRTQTINGAELKNLKVSFPNQETAIVTMDIKLENVDSEGRSGIENLRCATVYVKRGFEWMIVMRSHFPVKE